jgi:hypothetical protein
MKTLAEIISMNPAGLLLPHFGPILSRVEGFLRKNLEAVSRWGSMVSEAVKTGLSIDQIHEYFITDVAKHAGKSEDELPDHIRRILKLSAIGYHSYMEKRIANQSSLTGN